MAFARPSDARDAALQAEFNEKKWVWVPDDRDGYLAGWVVSEHDDIADVVMAAGGEVRHFQFPFPSPTIPITTCFPRSTNHIIPNGYLWVIRLPGSAVSRALIF